MDEDQLEMHEPAVADEPDAAPDVDRGSSRKALFIGAGVIALAILIGAWMLGHPRAVSFTTPYQAVLLSNGQVYFGHLEDYGTSNPVLSEVYYVQSTVDPQTKQQNNILLKRGKEWHGPDRMYINPQQIIIVEPVSPDSRVGELIKDLKVQR
jgi:hypothetical protein